MDFPFDAAFALSLLIVFLAAIVRGFSGFGFSLLAISALSLIYPPQQIFPAIFLMEIAASLHLLPSVWRHVHWRSLAPLLAGAIIGTPIGVWFLSTLPAPPMQLALATLRAALRCTDVGGLWFSRHAGASHDRRRRSRCGRSPMVPSASAGHRSSCSTSLLQRATVAGRASLVMFFLALDVIGLAFMSGMADLVGTQTVVRARALPSCPARRHVGWWPRLQEHG